MTACDEKNTSINWKSNEIKEDEECINNSYKIGFESNTSFGDKVLCPYIEFEGGNSSLEEKINDNLRQASTSWINKTFIKENKNTYYPEVFCHTSRFLSVGQSYETDNFITKYNFILQF